MLKELAPNYSRSAIYGQVVGFSPSRTEIRDWLQASFYLEDNHIVEVALMGRGRFMLKLSVVKKASNLVTNSPSLWMERSSPLYPGGEGSEPLSSTPSSMYPTFK